MRFMALLLLVVATRGVYAQQILFDKTIPEQNVPVESRLKNELRSHYINSRYVSQPDFFSQQDFFISITPGLIVKSKLQKMFNYPSGSVSYQGKLEGSVTGHITFSKYADRVAGTIMLDDGRKYMIDQTATNVFALSLSNESAFTQRESHADFIEVSGNSLPNAATTSVCDPGVTCTGPSTIDMMVVYTQQTENSWGGSANTIANITQAITNMNASMSNSGINNVTFRLVHTEKLSYTESGNFSTDLSRLAGTTDGYMDNVHALRDQYGADLVSLIIGSPTTSCGIGYLNTNPTAYSAGNAFNVSLYSCVVGNFTMAHECGHNMGLRHDWYVDPGTTPCTHMHGYVNQVALNLGASSPSSSRWRTIMAYNDRCSVAGFDCTRINTWSNPSMTFNGDQMGSPIGTAEPSNETYAFYRMACVVASFRPEAGQLTGCTTPSGISTSLLTSTSCTANWQAVSGAVSYDVDYKPSSTSFWINIASGTTGLSWDLYGMQPSTSYDWRVRANCSSGSSSYAQTTFSTLSQLASCNAPTGLSTLGITASAATATWAPVSGATSYNVDYKLSSSSSWINIASGTTGLSWDLYGMQPSTSYDWRVRANCSSGSSSYAQTTFSTLSQLTSCSAPTGLSTSGITASAATATWAPVSGATSYNVDYKLSSSSSWINIANGTTSLQWTLSGMNATTSYDWRVKANCSSASSGYTQMQFTTLALGSCSAPGGLFTSNITSGTATVSWNSVSGAIAYTVEYKPTSSGTWITASSGTYSTSVNLYGLSSATTYDWRVYTNCSLSETSTYSNAQFTTSGSTPPPSLGCPGPYDVSTNGTISGAALISLNTDIKGTIAPRNDIDHYQFTINSAGTITVSLTTLPTNYNMAVLNSSGTQIAVSQNNGTQSETISLNVAAGTYYAKVFPKGNATNATSCYTLRVQTGTAGDVIVNNTFTLNLFPNPANNLLNVWIEGVEQKAMISVYDIMGKLVMQQASTATLTQLNISKLSAGIYLLNVNNGKQSKAAKFVKE